MARQVLKQHFQKSIAISFAGRFLALLLLLFLEVPAVPALAQTLKPNSRQALTEEIRVLAQSDVENEIPRRTSFIVQLYNSNAAGITSPEVSQIYDKQYSEQIKQKNFYNLLIFITVIVFLGLLVVLLLTNKTRFKVKKVSTSLPFGLGQVELESDETMRRAAWSLYVELTTRITTQTLEGLLREALNSLYSLFASTRQILREAGPDVGTSLESVGGIAIAVLNVGLRPFLTKWHPVLSAWEAQRPTDVGSKEHEKNWSEEPQLRNELRLFRENLKQYTQALAKVIGIKN